ncbi:hypothetical protein J5X84_40530 [Streptosporangiaceae bacterium NEAU-GS5]|nr:hypothetical protein [Streptosporangiaceae bacterium NEAU-GS5]
MRAQIARSAGLAALAAGLVLAATAPAEAAAIPKYKAPAPYGKTFQADPAHDFTTPSSRHNGILRGWITSYKSGIATYTPIKWRESADFGEFVGTNKMKYASPISSKVAYYSAFGCGRSGTTVNKKFLGIKRCTRKDLLAYLKLDKHPALITVYKGQIIRLQEIYQA